MGASGGSRSGRGDTASRILDVAEQLVQTRGFNGFSYADVAERLKITKAALHHHFPSKADLGEALVSRYAGRFMAALDSVDRSDADAREKLVAYAGLYGDVLRARRMCLCGMLAAEYGTLPTGMRRAIRRFFDDNERWLEEVLVEGRAAGTVRFNDPATDAARMIISSLEGAMLVSRPFGDAQRFESAADELLASLTPGTPGP